MLVGLTTLRFAWSCIFYFMGQAAHVGHTEKRERVQCSGLLVFLFMCMCCMSQRDDVLAIHVVHVGGTTASRRR